MPLDHWLAVVAYVKSVQDESSDLKHLLTVAIDNQLPNLGVQCTAVHVELDARNDASCGCGGTARQGVATRKPYCSGSSQVDRVNDTLACHRACNPLAVQQATAFEYQIVFEFSAFVHLSQVDQPFIKT